jgi:hypothetical protein
MSLNTRVNYDRFDVPHAKSNHVSDVELGLCVNCVHREGCAFRRNVTGPIVCCEEHSSDDPGQAASVDAPPAKGITSQSLLVVHFAPKGLCINCSHEKDCVLPRREGGVWYCEEYE